ncbi:hypothetical protein HYH03_018181 [Edaphochlamys debaryana]|uniref:CxC2-like cysteine cluster KDZ transposase-associated domain-containing protein n=1 Tax=Edaphochlamys debaryana TaxID=47281 RepID=A0A835XMJ1_9CHLO|nr:hypothetical protein HYH03_018181 [Edaphochlamys debaryana]|eukprot:KAG2482899.1 hypothetical protein HYH03_018181 [Edaphochlamys debaryana]
MSADFGKSGCFVSSPVDPRTWYDLQVHKAYGVLCCDGLSVTAFTEYLAAIAADVPVPYAGSGSSGSESSASDDAEDGRAAQVTVDHRRFFASFMACQRARFKSHSLQRLGVEGMDTGPLCACPFCALRPQPADERTAEATRSPEDEAYPLAVAMDACGNKLGHYTACGAASRDQLPRLSRYFGPVDARVRALHLQGRLDLKSALGEAEAGAEAEADACVCQSSLHCSRPQASSSAGPLDVHGVCGAVCVHGFPVRGVFCDMQTPEQFAYYLLMLGHLVKQRPDLKHVYMDFGCRFKRTWERYVARRRDLPQSAAQLKIMVNWMHGAGHDLACQLTNSGRFTEGAGRQIGEEIEQLWSSTKPVGPLARYMTLSRRRDFIEMTLETVSDGKLKRVVQLLVGSYRRTLKKIREHESEVASAMSAAQRGRINDPPAAAAQYVRSIVGSSSPGMIPDEPDAWQMDYVLLRLRRKEMGQLTAKAPSLAVVSSSSAVTLAAASTSTQISKVDTAIRRLEEAHELLPDDWKLWKPSYAPFDAALQRLCDREINRCQARISANILEVQHGQQERAQAGCADRETKRIQSRLKRKRAQIRTSLDEMYVWQGLQLGAERVMRLTEEQVKALYVPGQQPPWSTPASTLEAQQIFHGRKYHESATELARAREQLRYVRMDKVRLETWIQGAAACVQAARDRRAAVGCAGSTYLLDRRLGEIRVLRAALAANEQLLARL